MISLGDDYQGDYIAFFEGKYRVESHVGGGEGVGAEDGTFERFHSGKGGMFFEWNRDDSIIYRILEDRSVAYE